MFSTERRLVSSRKIKVRSGIALRPVISRAWKFLYSRCNLLLPVHTVTVPSPFYKSSVSNGDTRSWSLSSCNLLWYELKEKVEFDLILFFAMNVKVQPVICTQNKALTNRREYYVASLNRQCRFSKPPQFIDMFTRNTQLFT